MFVVVVLVVVGVVIAVAVVVAVVAVVAVDVDTVVAVVAVKNLPPNNIRKPMDNKSQRKTKEHNTNNGNNYNAPTTISANEL